jgi:hypothetical protein
MRKLSHCRRSSGLPCRTKPFDVLKFLLGVIDQSSDCEVVDFGLICSFVDLIFQGLTSPSHL